MEIKETPLNDETQTTAKAPEVKTREQEIADKFAPFANMSENELKNNQAFLRAVDEVVNEELSHLPTAKFLEQKFERSPSNSLYSECVNKLFGDFEAVNAGMGVEYCLTNGTTVGTLDRDKFVPDRRTDVDKFTYWTSLALPDQIKQVQISASPWMYIDFFLSGKVEDYVNLVVNKARETLELTQNYEALQLIKQIFSSQYALASSDPSLKTAHLVGKKRYIVDAVKEMKDFIFQMFNHQQQFAYDTQAFKGYNNLMLGDERYICEIETYNNIKKVAMTFLSKEEFTNFTDLSKWVILPKTIFNPNTGVVEDLNLFVDRNNQRVKGAVMVLGKSGLKRLTNLQNAYSEFYPNNLTTQHWFNARYTQGILPWAQVAVYNNEALEQDFYLPTEQVVNA